MKKLLLFAFVLVFAGTAFGQVAYLQYRNVPAEHQTKFEERETKHWSKVAKAAIEKGITAVAFRIPYTLYNSSRILAIELFHWNQTLPISVGFSVSVGIVKKVRSIQIWTIIHQYVHL